MTAPLRYRSADDKTCLRAREQEAQDVDLEAERVSTLLQEPSSSKVHPERSLILGSICTGGLIAVWIGGAKAHAYYPSLLPDGEITQDLFLLIRYTNMSACAVLLPVSRYLQTRAVTEVAQRDVADDVAEKRFTFSTQFGDPAALETFKRAALFCWIYYLMGYTYMASLQYNTIGVNTSLYNIYVVFVLVLSKLVLKEEVTPSKVGLAWPLREHSGNIYVVFVLALSKLVLKEEVTPSKVGLAWPLREYSGRVERTPVSLHPNCKKHFEKVPRLTQNTTCKHECLGRGLTRPNDVSQE